MGFNESCEKPSSAGGATPATQSSKRERKPFSVRVIKQYNYDKEGHDRKVKEQEEEEAKLLEERKKTTAILMHHGITASTGLQASKRAAI